MDIASSKYLIAFCHDWMGLANRLKCLVSAQALAKETERELLVYWESTDMCCACFEDLYVNPFHRISFDELFAFIENSSFEVVESAKACSRSSVQYVLFVSPSFAFPPHVIEPYLKSLKLQPTLQKTLTSFSKSHALSSSIGLHIRRGDFMRDPYNKLRLSSDDFFIKAINSQLELGPCSFYLCTDNPVLEEELSQKYPSSIIVRKKVLSRSSLEGMQDSLLDLYLLSTTKKIIGTMGSTFTQVAYWIGDSKRELLVSGSTDAIEAFRLCTIEVNPSRQMNTFAYFLTNALIVRFFKERRFLPIFRLITLSYVRVYIDSSRHNLFDELDRIIGVCGMCLLSVFPSLYRSLKKNFFKHPLPFSSHKA